MFLLDRSKKYNLYFTIYQGGGFYKKITEIICMQYCTNVLITDILMHFSSHLIMLYR